MEQLPVDHNPLQVSFGEAQAGKFYLLLNSQEQQAYRERTTCKQLRLARVKYFTPRTNTC